jgi:hypothetical protein
LKLVCSGPNCDEDSISETDEDEEDDDEYIVEDDEDVADDNGEEFLNAAAARGCDVVQFPGERFIRVSVKHFPRYFLYFASKMNDYYLLAK